jgi:SNF2 family DNA or RNA helicase
MMPVKVLVAVAPGVGLGKTVEAGLVIAELIARRRAHRILIVSPAGPLLEQWRAEMRDRFGLRFDTVCSSGELQERRRSLVLGASPFDHLSFCLTSIDFAKQEKVLQELERTVWDLVIIDEAHHCVSLGSGGDWEDSQRRRLAEVLAKQTDGLLLLTPRRMTGSMPTLPRSWSCSIPASWMVAADSVVSAIASMWCVA